MLNIPSNELEKRIEDAEVKILSQAHKGEINIRINNPELGIANLNHAEPWETMEAALVGYSNENKKEIGEPSFNGTADNVFKLYDIVKEINEHTQRTFECNRFNTQLLERELENFDKLIDTLSKIMIYENLGIDLYNAYMTNWGFDGYARTKFLTHRYAGYVRTSIKDLFNEGKEVKLILVGKEHGYIYNADEPLAEILEFSPYCYSGDLKPIK